jgi:hypothetical protein
VVSRHYDAMIGHLSEKVDQIEDKGFSVNAEFQKLISGLTFIKDNLCKHLHVVNSLEAYKLSNPVHQKEIDASLDYYKCQIELELLKRSKQISIDYYQSW